MQFLKQNIKTQSSLVSSETDIDIEYKEYVISSINRGLEDVYNNKIFSHEIVKNKIKKWLNGQN